MKKVSLIFAIGVVLLISRLSYYTEATHAQIWPSLSDSKIDLGTGRNFRSLEPPVFAKPYQSGIDFRETVEHPVRTDSTAATRLNISWTQLGPNGGQPGSFAVDPSNPARMFVGGRGVLYRTENDGATWTPANIGLDIAEGSVDSILINPGNSEVIFAGVSFIEAGVYKSIDRGNTWTKVLAANIRPLAFDPVNSSVIYAGAANGAGVYKSLNSGTSWTQMNSGLPAMASCRGFAIHPANSNVVFVATSEGLFRSTDGGANWSASNTSNINFGASISISRTNPSVLAYGVRTQVVYKSLDGGQTWNPTNPVANNVSVDGVYIDPQNPDIWYARVLQSPYIYKTTNGGNSWSSAASNLPLTSFSPLSASILGTPSRIYVLGFGYNFGNVYESSNGASSWIRKGANVVINDTSSLALVANFPDRIIATAGMFDGAIFRSDDAGANWERYLDQFGNPLSVASFAVAPSNENIIYGGSNYIYKSSDGGITWALQTGYFNFGISDLAVDVSNPSVVYASTSYFGGTPGFGVFKSTDEGNSFSPILNGLPTNPNSGLIRVHPTNPAILFAGLEVFGTAGGEGNGVYRSLNAGSSWSASDPGSGLQRSRALTFDPNNPDVMYASSGGTAECCVDIFKSINGGNTWNRLYANLNDYAYALQTHPNIPNIVVAGTAKKGVFVSTNGGVSWGQANAGLGSRRITTLRFNPATPNFVYAGTVGGGVHRGLITQIPCTFSLNQTAQNFPASGGLGTLTINTQETCRPSVSDDRTWLTPTSTLASQATVMLNYIVAANYGSQPRTGTIMIEGQSFTVQQAAASTACVPPPTGLVAWWRGEGNALDETGINNGSPTSINLTYGGGKVGGGFKGIEFLGEIEVPDSPSLALNQSMTFEGWLKIDSDGGTVIERRTTNLPSYSIGILSRELHFFVWFNSNSGTGVFSDPLPLDQFVHFAATLDDATGQIKMYINGSLMRQSIITQRPNVISGAKINLARINGITDELSVYNRALSASEIQAIYNAGVAATGATGKCPLTNLNVSVSGRVLTPDRRGLRNATVSITDSQGVRRTATTSSFGFFSFDNVATGQQYTFRVQSRLYRYSPVNVTVNDNLTLPDFVGLE